MNVSLTSFSFQFICMARLLVASACGFAIGFERKNRLKEAGMRTHIIVALGAALMMIVSKYGFFDLIGYSDLLKADASRIAAQIVSGVGFLGAGMIFVRNRSVTGLTTAAGIWTTAGVGMAVGAGMYLIGIASTGMVLATQYLLHTTGRFFYPDVCSVGIRVNEKSSSVSDAVKAIQDLGAQLVEMDVSQKKNSIAKVDLRLRLNPGLDRITLMEKLDELPFIAEIEE
jgi:putative Mg2+ transporter-C (MgtC) family protein